MKTLKILLTLSLLFSFKFCLAWSIEINNPNGSSSCPSRYKYSGQGGTFDIQFTLSGLGGTYTYDYWVNLKSGGSTFFTSSTSQTSTNGTKTVSLSYSNVCMNNVIEVEVVVRNQSNYSDQNTANGKYYIMYTNYSYTSCPSNNNKAVINGSSTPLNSNYVLGTFYHGGPCGVSSSVYAYKRYKVEWTVSGSFTNSSISVNNQLSLGYNGAIPNYQYMQAYVDNITSTSAHFYTFVYELKTSLNGEYLGYYPCAPGDAAIIYTVTQNQAPVISGFTQTPSVIYPGMSGTVVCNLSQGNCCNISYNWSYENKPSYISVSFSGNTATITNNHTFDYVHIGDLVGAFKVCCNPSNNYGSTNGCFLPITSTNGGGCPWVFVRTEDSVFSEENNILHRSEFPGNEDEDIIDLYKINSIPYTTDKTLKIKVLETGRKYSYFDQFKLYAVNHSTSTELGVTENNTIVLYTVANVLSTDTANFNDTTDITDLIQYPYTLEGDPADGDTLDHAYVHFPSNSYNGFAVLTNMDYDRVVPVAKWDAANVTCYTSSGNSSSSFAMRELSHDVIIPFNFRTTVNVYNTNLTYQRHFNVKYVALTTYSTVNSYEEADLISAELQNVGDITNFVGSIDTKYGEMDSLSTILLTFNLDKISSPAEDEKTDYILVTVGRYINSNPNDNIVDNLNLQTNNSKNTIQSSPVDYKLHENYPNPFNPVTQIKYDIKNKGLVKLTVYNVLGQIVKELVNEIQEQGNYSIFFDGSTYASGVYFYKLETGDFVDSKKMVLIK